MQNFAPYTTTKGFTLIELMIVLMIMSILAAIALPSYRQFILRNHESKVKSILANYAIQMEQWRAKALTYSNFTPTGVKSVSDPVLGDLEADNKTIYYPASSTATTYVYAITINTVADSTTGPTFPILKTSTIANRWVMLATPRDQTTGLTMIGLTSTGAKCQSKDYTLELKTLWDGDCGTGSTEW